MVAACPSGFVTVTVTAPAAPAGAVTTSWVAEKPVTTALLAANVTVTPVRNPVPVSVTLFPPASGPPARAIPVTVGAALYAYDVVAAWPSGLVAVTVTGPTLPAGAVTTTCVAVDPVTVAPLAPKVTVTPVRNPVPVSVTAFPPAGAPFEGAIAEIVGAGL